MTYRRPIYERINLLADAGFRIERFYEFGIDKDKLSGLEGELMGKYPRLMVFKVSK